MINYITGDATSPVSSVSSGHKLIIHCCNDEGRWGAGFVLALTKKWPWVERSYREWYNNSANGGMPSPDERVKIFSDDPFESFHLGAIQVVDVAEDISVVNMIGQDGCGKDKYDHPPVRYYAIEEALKKIRKVAYSRLSSIHCPRFGAGLAGGNWDIIHYMLDIYLEDQNVTVYDFKA